MAVDTWPSPLTDTAAGAPSGVPPVPAPPSAPRPRRPTVRRSAWLAPITLGALLLVIWEALARFAHVPALVLPGPDAVATAFWYSLADWLLPGNAAWTLAESLAGFTLGTLVALPLGYAVARSRWMAWAIQPYLAASQALPAVALAPLLVLWLGYGLLPTAALCALIVFFPATITTTLGLRALDRDILDAARVDGATRWSLLRHVELPLALPAILAGLRASLTLSITGAVVGEFVVGDQGLGYLINYWSAQHDTAQVFATLIALGLLAASLYGLARLVERQFSHLEEG